MIFNADAKLVAEFGEWSKHDREMGGRKSFSPEKTNKKNNCKQKARAALGYNRAKIVDRSTESF